ncbi:hypothetical protein [Methylomonas sp. AM2-LC]|uniref:hypothetical protein n=1 Tax=Methylomonas sp. AM2-LC TaxID=3153301 RepID=UPI0032646B19
MYSVILIGTTHPIQLGESSLDLFKKVLREQCQSHRVEGVAEEIKNGDATVALALAAELQPPIPHLYADPDIKERMEHGMPSNIADIILGLQNEYAARFPEIRCWPRNASSENLPQEVWNEYLKRSNDADRMREQIWLNKIISFDKWPLLFICGADHFIEFSKLLKQNGVRVVEVNKDWSA